MFQLVGASRLYRVVHSNRNIPILKRYLSSSNKNENDLGINTSSYKPSTAKQETHIPDNLQGGQAKETFDTTSKSTATLTDDGKVWSVQNPGSVHVAPLGTIAKTTVPPASVDGKLIHDTTVYTTQGELNLADPFTSHVLQGEPTPGQLAEAAAASAFETFAPDTPLATPSATDTVFAPKISSTDVYSTTTSPTGQFENGTASTTHDTTQYETSNKSKIFGGQDTSASSKTHSNKSTYKTRYDTFFFLIIKIFEFIF